MVELVELGAEQVVRWIGLASLLACLPSPESWIPQYSSPLEDPLLGLRTSKDQIAWMARPLEWVVLEQIVVMVCGW
jgi:hypothetical protein